MSSSDMQQSLLSAAHDGSQPLNYQSVQSQHAQAIPPNTPSHLQHRYRAKQLPPYPKYASLKDQFLALSRLNQCFLVILVLLWPLSIIPASTRLVAVLLPILFIPTVALYFVYQRYYSAHVELNLLVHTYATAFTLGALIVAFLETLLTVVFASFTLYWQLDELAKWLLQQGGPSGAIGTAGGDSSDPFGFISKTVGFFFFIFLVAFCVAGCVEESLKYALTVRIKRLTPGFADRNGFLLYAATAALGFSTFENIGYAYIVTAPALAVLLNIASRVLVSTPLHVCCGFLTGIGVVRRDVYGEKLPLWRVMALPVAIHGAFDFFLILAAALMADDWPLLGVEAAIVVATFVALGVAIWLEMRHISGAPPVLPTSMASEAEVDGSPALPAEPQQPGVAESSRRGSRAYREEHESHSLV